MNHSILSIILFSSISISFSLNLTFWETFTKEKQKTIKLEKFDGRCNIYLVGWIWLIFFWQKWMLFPCWRSELSFCNLISITEADCVSQGPSGGKLTVDIKQHPPPPPLHRSPGFPASLWTLECCVIAPLLLPPLQEAIFWVKKGNGIPWSIYI